MATEEKTSRQLSSLISIASDSFGEIRLDLDAEGLMNLGTEMALSSLHGLLDLLTNIDNDVNPETIRRTALLGLMLVSEHEDGFQNGQSGNVLTLTANTR